MIHHDMEEYRLKFSESAIEDILEKIKSTIIFDYYTQFNKDLELSIILDEVRAMLEKGLSLEEVVYIQNMEMYSDEEDDLKKAAKLCLQLVFQDMVQSRRDKFKKLNGNEDFASAFAMAKAEIVKFLLKTREDFPTEAVKCVYLLIDGDCNPDEQLLTAQRLVMECLPYTTTAEQAQLLQDCVFNARL